MTEKQKTVEDLNKEVYAKWQEGNIGLNEYYRSMELISKTEAILKIRQKMNILKSLSASDFEKMKKEVIDDCVPKEKVRDFASEVLRQIKKRSYNRTLFRKVLENKKQLLGEK